MYDERDIIKMYDVRCRIYDVFNSASHIPYPASRISHLTSRIPHPPSPISGFAVVLLFNHWKILFPVLNNYPDKYY